MVYESFFDLPQMVRGDINLDQYDSKQTYNFFLSRLSSRRNWVAWLLTRASWRSMRPPDSYFEENAPLGKSFMKILSSSMFVDCSQVPDVSSLGSHKGEPASELSKDEMSKLAEPFRNVFVERFTSCRPPTKDIRKFFVSLGLKGACSVGLLDSNHILIQPTREEDYPRLFVRKTWFI